MKPNLFASLKKPLQFPLIAVSLLLPCLMGNGTAHAATKSVATLGPDGKPLDNVKKHWYQVGRASWYGKGFQGRSTASGEHFDLNLLTAAHRTLPLGSWIRVTNLRNHKTVVVKVNDRGPVPQDRVLDLSQAAARMLGFNGTTSVKVEMLKDVAGVMMAKMQAPALLAAH